MAHLCNPKIPDFWMLPKPDDWEIVAKIGTLRLSLTWLNNGDSFAIITPQGKLIRLKTQKAARRRWCREIAEAICRARKA